MVSLPRARNILVRLGQGWIDVDRTQYFVQPNAVAHGEHELDDQIARAVTDDRSTENFVSTRHGEYFDHAVCFFVDDSSIEIFERVTGHLVTNVVCLRL